MQLQKNKPMQNISPTTMVLKFLAMLEIFDDFEQFRIYMY